MTPMKLILVHGYTGHPEKNWFPWLKAEAEKLGIETLVPAMPHPDSPQLSEWLPYLRKTVGTPNEHTYLVGHSLGGPTILRYLESLTEGQGVGGIILVAGCAEPIKLTELDNFMTGSWDDDKIERSSKSIVLINSDNDEYIPIEMAHRLRDRLHAKLITLHNAGHINERAGYKKLPIVLEELKQMGLPTQE